MAADAAPGPSPIALDALGADQGAAPIVAGARTAAAEGIRLRVFGRPAELGELRGRGRGGALRGARGDHQRRGSAARGPLAPERVGRRRRVRRGRRQLRCARQRRADRRDDGGGDLRDQAPARRPSPGARGPAPQPGAPRAPGAAARRRRLDRGARPAPDPVRPPRLGLRARRPRRRAPPARPALGRRGVEEGEPDRGRGARGARRLRAATSSSPATSRAATCSPATPTSSSPTASPATSP